MPRKLKKLRLERGYTLKTLAEMSGVGASTIGNYETGKTDMAPETLKKIAESLKVSAEELQDKTVYPISPPAGVKVLYESGEGATQLDRVEHKLDQLLRHLGVDGSERNP